jgi:hypothetical protein
MLNARPSSRAGSIFAALIMGLAQFGTVLLYWMHAQNLDFDSLFRQKKMPDIIYRTCIINNPLRALVAKPIPYNKK